MFNRTKYMNMIMPVLFTMGRTEVASKDQGNQGKRENFLLEKVYLWTEKVYLCKQLVQCEEGSIGVV